MKKIFNFYSNTNLILRIFIGIVIGALLGIAVPKATAITILGTLFTGTLKAIAPILVLVLVISSLANAKSTPDKRFALVIFFYMLSTFLAAVVAVFSSFAFPQKIQLTESAVEQTAPSGIVEVLESLLVNMVSNPITAIAEANYVSILFWAILLGIMLRQSSDTTKNVFQDLSTAVSGVVKFVINLAPFGIAGLVFTTVSTSGISIFADYGKLLALLVGCMLAVALIVDPLIVALALKRNPYPLVFKCLKNSGLTAFFTRSSAANIPVNMKLCEEMGLDKEMYSVSIPLGATINMDGAAITITVMTLAAAHTMGVAVDIPTAILLSVIATLGACGASGVAGGSLLLIPMACSMFGISADIAMQVVGVGFIIGVVQDSLETAINSAGDVMFTTTAEFVNWQKQGRALPDFMGKKK